MHRVGRNDPCPCGSGKKYKKCCLTKTSIQPTEFLYKKLRQLEDKLVEKLMHHAKSAFGDFAMQEAWFEFLLFPEDEPDVDFESIHTQAFFPWFLFNWNRDTEGRYRVPRVAESYLNRNRKKLSEMEINFLELSYNHEFSFHEVTECHPGEGFMAKDIFLERETFVTEHTSSKSIQKGDILFAKVIRYDNLGLLGGSAPFSITPGFKPSILDLRARMRRDDEGLPLDTEDLRMWDIEIRELYLAIHHQMFTPPTLTNTDGHLLVFHEIHYELSCSPGVAYDQLKALALGVHDEEWLDDAEYDANNQLTKIFFKWMKADTKKKLMGDYTTLGDLTIDGKTLKISVNSKERAEIIRKEVEDRLGENAKYQATKIQSQESMLSGARTPDGPPSAILESSELDSELQAHMEKMLEKHWDQWIHDQLPALNGKSPIESVKDPDGREKVIALLNDIERHEQKRTPQLKQQKFIDRARQQLGLE